MSGSFKWLLAICVAGTLLGASLPAKAAVSNGDFETGNLAGWTPIGAVHVDTAAIGTAPSQGTFHAYIDNTGNFTVGGAAVVASLGVDGSDIAAFGIGPITTGSGLSQDLTVSAGDVLTFDWNFLTDEHNEGIQYNDFCFFSITTGSSSDAFFLASRDSTFSTLDLVSPPPGFDGQSHYATQSYTFTSAGTFKLGFGIFNVQDGGHNSVLLIDNVALSVPEPFALSMFTPCAFVLLRRRNHGAKCAASLRF